MTVPGYISHQILPTLYPMKLAFNNFIYESLAFTPIEWKMADLERAFELIILIKENK